MTVLELVAWIIGGAILARLVGLRGVLIIAALIVVLQRCGALA